MQQQPQQQKQQQHHLQHLHQHQQQQHQKQSEIDSNKLLTTTPRSCTTNIGQASLTASAKIQQKQQKFLAAAARSATSPAAVILGDKKQQATIPPDHHHHHHQSQQQQQNHHLHQQQQHYHLSQWKSATAAAAAAACCPASQAAACQTHHQQQQSTATTNNPAQRAYAPQQLRQSSPSARSSTATDGAPICRPISLSTSTTSTNNTVVSAALATTTSTQAQQQQHQSQQRHQIHNFNINNNNNNYHHYNHHNHHHNHHHQLQNQQHQHQHQHTMAHYKFHNDCQSSVLTYEQVKRLDFVMDQTVPIHGRGQFPTLYVKLKELIRLVKYKLQREHSIEIRDVRLNGGAASYVLAPENSHYNDLDLIFGTDLSDEDQFDVIRDVVLECLKEFIPKEFQSAVSTTTNQQLSSYQMPLNSCSIKEAYVHKMVKVNDDDRWSLISLGVQQSEGGGGGGSSISSNSSCCGSQANCSPVSHHQQQQAPSQEHREHQFLVTLTAYENEHVALNENNKAVSAKQHQVTYVHHEHHQNQRNHYHQHQQQKQFPNSIELKFVDRMRRKFEFSVDSFQIILDSLIQFYDYAPQSTITSQRKLINSHPSSTMINTRPLINERRCTGCCGGGGDLSALDNSCEVTTNESLSATSIKPMAKVHSNRENYNNSNSSQQQNNDHQIINGFRGVSSSSSTTTKQCASLLNSSRSYYQLPIEPANSPNSITSSVASSSGCSSSSSVVSSSSSSLSCDDDHEDLYCDVDGPSSSSASTSSLLSSTNLSVLSSEGSDFKCSQQQQQCESSNNNHQEPKPSDDMEDSSSGSNKENDQPKDGLEGDEVPPGEDTTEEIEQQQAVNLAKCTTITISTSSFNADLISSSTDSSSKVPTSGATASHCVTCHLIGQRDNLLGCGYDFETMAMGHGGRTSCAVISANFYPTVIGRSEYGNFKEALYHLEKKLIATRSPEEIRGGGLLKYCNLLVKNYKPTNVYQIRTLERYMCSRFFIDFSDLNQQQAKLESYLANHFSDDPILKFDYLTILHNVVQRSTVCLMNHELRLTLNMIRDLAYKLNEQQHQQQQKQQQQQHPAQLTIFGRK